MQVEHVFFLRKGQAFTNYSADALPECIIEPFYMIGLPTFLACFLVCLHRQAVVGAPQIAEAIATQVFIRSRLRRDATAACRTP